MALQFKFFTIPIKDSISAEAEMNRFLESVKVITVHRDFVVDGGNSCRIIDIEYQSGDGAVQMTKSGGFAGKKKVDYREVLSPDDFAIYARLRDWRKETGEKEGVQLYNILTNEQMAHVVQNKICSKGKLKEISGVGEARVEKYGDPILAIMTEEIGKRKDNTDRNGTNEKGEESLRSDSDPAKSEGSVSQGGHRQAR